MIYKGCIVSVEKNYSVVITEKMEYIKIINKEEMKVGNKIIFLEDDIYVEKRYVNRYIGLIAAMLFLVIISIPLLRNLNTSIHSAVAIVSIDINPSIEFEIDKDYIVIKAIPLNSEGQDVISKPLEGIQIDKAILSVVNNAKDKNYITDEKNEVIIGTAIIDDKFIEDEEFIYKNIEKRIESQEVTKQLNIVYTVASKEDIKDAKSQRISIGKYEKLKQENKSNINQINSKVEQIKNDEIKEEKNKSDKKSNEIIEKVKDIKINKDHIQQMKNNEKENKVRGKKDDTVKPNRSDEKINKNNNKIGP
ncbi:anti-sigma factor domain-containing protein [Alkalithermobacter paradoxus]|uniref:Anti-sigma-I factor RsgI n=1 Tax=Alkalithermobacter paradoxus TaxID=29349 RepID=A0A1V4I8Y9_9FIRM|nr:anti-sigma-I factor RsgI [[Clostridium] thermoalcaliphilum]